MTAITLLKMRWFPLVVLGVLFSVVMVITTYQTFTLPYPGHNDFMSRWEGARSFWVDGLNPYGDEASLNIQRAIYGQPATAFQDPGYFVYPFYTAFAIFPFVWTSYAWASAIWMVLLEILLLVTLGFILHYFRWKPSPIMLGGLALWMLLSYIPARGLVLGQLAFLVYFLEILTIWALARRYDKTAAIALAWSTIKPQMGYLLIPFLLLWAFRQKRWEFLGAFLVSMALLFGVSFLFVPTWLSDWIHQVGLYPSYTTNGSPVWILANLLWLNYNPATGFWSVNGGYGEWIEFALSVALYLYLLWSWYAVLVKNRQEQFVWTVVLTLLVTHLVAPRTATPHYIVFVFPMIFYLRELTTRFRRRGSLYVWIVLIVLFFGQWIHFLLTVDGDFEDPTVFLPTPFLLLIVLVLTRRWWWQDKRDLFQTKDH